MATGTFLGTAQTRHTSITTLSFHLSLRSPRQQSRLFLMTNDDLTEIRKACMKVVDDLDRLTVEITVAKVTLEDINTKLMFDLKDDGQADRPPQ